MRVQCEKCGLVYFDEIKTTICPHPPLGVAPEDYCRTHDLIRQYQPGAFEAIGCPTHEKEPDDEPPERHDETELQALRDRYRTAAHAMQAGVAMMQNYKVVETTPKHLRVGVNSAMVDSAALARLLIGKGVISEKEYLESLVLGMEEEVREYEKELESRLGSKVKLV